MGGGGAQDQWAAMQDPTLSASEGYNPYGMFQMALKARQGYMPPFMRRFAERQYDPLYNEWRRQGAVMGEEAPGWADYLTGKYKLGGR